MFGVHSSPIVRYGSIVPSLGEVAPPLDLLVESLEVKMMNRRLLLLDLLVPASLIVLLVSFACNFFWIIHKIFEFVGEAPVHLLLGVSEKKNKANSRLD